MKYAWLWVATVTIIGHDLHAQCVSPSMVERGVQLYQKPVAAPAPPTFWDEFKSMFSLWNPPSALPFQRSVAFLVGVSDYKSPDLKKLPGVENDLNNMCKYLLSQGGFDLVYVARGPAATVRTVNYYMMDFFHDKKNLSENDRLLFYYSGHGADDGGRDAYLLFGAASRGKFGDDEVLAVDSWEKWSNRLPAKHALFVFDACVAGEVLENKSAGETERERIEGMLATLSGDGSRTVVTAGTSDQETWYANEKSLGYSVFTSSLLDVLQARAGESLMSIDEAVEEAAKRTAAYTHDKKASPAIPDVRRFDTAKRSGRFVFLNPSAKDRALPEQLASVLTSKGPGMGPSEPETFGVLKLITELGKIQDNPALSLYVGARALEISKGSEPMPSITYYLDKALNRGAIFARIPTAHLARQIVWSPDGKSLAINSDDGEVRSLEPMTEEAPRTVKSGMNKYDFKYSRMMEKLSWTANGRKIVWSDASDKLHVRNLDTEKTIDFPESKGFWKCVAWKADGTMLATSTSDGKVALWNISTGQGSTVLKGENDGECDLAWSSDGETLAYSRNDKSLTLLGLKNLKIIRTLKDIKVLPGSLTWSPDGKILAWISGDGFKSIYLGDPVTGRIIRTLQGDTTSLNGIAWSPDGKTLASGSDENTVLLWDLRSSGETIAILRGHKKAVSAVAWSPDSRTIVSGGEDLTVKLWNPQTGVNTLTLTTPGFNSGIVSSVGWSPDGKVVASALNNGLISLWVPETGKLIRTLKENFGFLVNHLAWSPDGKRLASADENGGQGDDRSPSQESAVHIWDPETGGITRTITIDHGYDAYDTGSVSWSPDGKTLASGSLDGSILLWASETGENRGSLDGVSKAVLSTAWSPNGKMLASGGEDNLIHIWTLESKDDSTVLRGHFGAVRSVAWSPDGTTLVSGSDDGTIRFWDVRSGESVRSMAGHNGGVNCVAWSPDGTTVASAGADGTIRLWSGGIKEMLKQVKYAIRQYAPTPEECRRYFNSESCPVLR
jgi:WD40 repeat protein